MTDMPRSVEQPSRRRILVAAGGALVLAGGAGFALWQRDRFSGDALTPPEVLAALETGDILLIDIRRPDEWAATGIAWGATPLDMRRDDFVVALTALTGGVLDRPVALICARGVRSDRSSARLTRAGFTHVIDVPEGMLGSSAGPGWLARGLPVVQP